MQCALIRNSTKLALIWSAQRLLNDSNTESKKKKSAMCADTIAQTRDPQQKFSNVRLRLDDFIIFVHCIELL